MVHCIYCQARAGDTRDHVPPKQLLRRPYPRNLFTVPACRPCNSALSADEEYFRASIVGLLCHSDEANQLFDGPISRSFDRRPSLEGQLFSQLEASDDGVVVNFDYDRIGNVIGKVVRGLEFAISKRAIERSMTLHWVMQEVAHGSSDQRFAPDFSFFLDENYWEFTLYNSLEFRVSTDPANLLR
jgi:hypothetical protein